MRNKMSSRIMLDTAKLVYNVLQIMSTICLNPLSFQFLVDVSFKRETF